MKGDCFDIFSVNDTDFFDYCSESKELSLYIYNDYFENIYFNINLLQSVENLTLIGLSNSSKIQIYQDKTYKTKLNFESKNISINFVSSYSCDFAFSSITTSNTIFQTYSRKISSNNIKTDIFSLSSYPTTVLCRNVEIDFSTPFHTQKSLLFQYDNFNQPMNLILTSCDIPFIFTTNNGFTTVESSSTSGILSFYFNFTVDKLNFQINDKSEKNNHTIVSNVVSSKMNPWSCGYFSFSFKNSGDLTVNFDGPLYYISSLDIHKLTLNGVGNSPTVIKLNEYSSSDPEKYPCTIQSSEKIIIDLFTDSKSQSIFTGKGQVNILSDFHIVNYHEMSFNEITFKHNNPYIYVDITRGEVDAQMLFNSTIDINGTVNIVPYYDPSKFSIPQDVPTLLNHNLFSVCAPNINIDDFVINCPDDIENLPLGFTNNDLSFSLKQVTNCVSLFLEKDPANFTSTSCIYATNSSLCSGISDDIYDATKNESPFLKEITTDYIDVIIVETLPADYVLNINKIMGNHHINFTYQGEADQTIPFHFVDFREDSKNTSLIFNQLTIILDSKSGQYDTLSLFRGSKIQNYVNLENTSKLEVNFLDIITHRPFYGCTNIIAYDVDAANVIYSEDDWTFLTLDQKSLTVSNSVQLTLVLDQDRIKVNFSSPNIKPLTFRVGNKDLLSIDIEDFPAEPLSTSAILIDFTSEAQKVLIILPNDQFVNFPISFNNLSGATTFESMKRVFIMSNSQSITVDYLNTFVINEKSPETFIAFSKLSNTQLIYSIFPGIEINSNAFIISETFDTIDQFKTSMYSTSNLEVNRGATATLIYPDLKGSIAINDDSRLVLFHPRFADMLEINFNINFYHIYHHKTPYIKLIEKQSQLEMTSKTPFYIPDDNDKPFQPKSIIIQHKLPSNLLNKMDFKDGNEIEYPLLFLKSIDVCDDVLKSVSFDPKELITADGVINFDKKCQNNELIVVCTYQEVIHTTPPKGSNKVNIIIISTLSSVLLVAIIVIVVLVIMKRKKQTPDTVMKSMLLTIPKDI